MHREVERAEAVGRSGDESRDDLGELALAEEQHVAFVGEVTEERAGGQACPLRDLRNGGRREAALGEQARRDLDDLLLGDVGGTVVHGTHARARAAEYAYTSRKECAKCPMKPDLTDRGGAAPASNGR